MFFGFMYFKLFPGMAIWEKYIFSTFLIGASLLPDIDTPTSTLGRKHTVISYLATHRGSFHSIWLPLVSVFFALIYPVLSSSLLAIAIGYGAHLVADAFTKHGIKPFAPLSKYKISGPLKTGSFVETLIAAAVVMFFLVQPF